MRKYVYLQVGTNDNVYIFKGKAWWFTVNRFSKKMLKHGLKVISSNKDLGEKCDGDLNPIRQTYEL